MGEAESQGISSVGQTMSARLVESRIWLADSVSLSAFLSGRKLYPRSRLGARHPNFSLYTTGAFPVPPWCWGSEGVSLCKCVCCLFKRNCLGLPKFLPPTQSPLVFAARSCGDLSWHGNPGGGAWCGAETPPSRDVPPEFLSTTCRCGTTPFRVRAPPTSLDGCGFSNS